jgi:hypothetical protein
MNEFELFISEFNWAGELVIGSLLLKAETDNNGAAINPNAFYKVGKHKVSGKVAIIPTEMNIIHESMNDILKVQNRFN